MKDQEIKELITIPRCAASVDETLAIICEYHAQWFHERGKGAMGAKEEQGKNSLRT
jgi:hypothetical protein